MDSTATSTLSGGQTGADRAALDFALAHGIKVWNAAGPRGSQEPDLAGFVTATLAQALPPDDKPEPPATAE